MRRILFCIMVLAALAACGGRAYAIHYVPPQKYNQQFTLHFSIYDSNSPWQYYETAPAADDVYIRKDGGTAARAANAVTDLDHTMSLVLTATEMTAAVITVDVNDESSPALYGSDTWVIYTHGNASAQNAFDLDSATVGLAAGGITASILATDCITSDELAATGLTEIENEILDASLQGNNHQTKFTVGYYLRRAAGGDTVTLHSGTAQAGAAGSITLQNTASATDDVYNLQRVSLIGGTGVGQSRVIADYVGSTFVATVVTPWITTPDATSEYLIEAATISEYADVGLAQDGDPCQITLATTASAYDNIYTGFVTITSGTGSGQTREIYDVGTWYDGATKVLKTSTDWDTEPDGTSVYAIFPFADTQAISTGATVEQVQWAIDARIDTTDALLGTPGDTDLSTDVNNLALIVDALTTTIGTPADTDIATDIANVVTATISIDANDLANTVLITTVAGATNAQKFVLTAGKASANFFLDHVIKITDGDDGSAQCRRIKSYSAGREIVVDKPFGFTPAATDAVIIYSYTPESPSVR